MIPFRHERRAAWLLSLVPLLIAQTGCRQTTVVVRPIEQVRTHGILDASEIAHTYGSAAFVYREGIPGISQNMRLRTDLEITATEPVHDANLIIFVEGSGDQLIHFRHTAHLLAESDYHPPGDLPHLLILLVHWSETTRVVREHLNYQAQAQAAETLKRMCHIHQRRHPDGQGFVGIIGFSAGTRITQLAFGAVLPEGRPGDKPPFLSGVPDEMKHVRNVVYLGSSINREDPLPFQEIDGRFINFINYRDTHYGDRAPYFAPAGTSPVLLRVLEANLYLTRPRTGASANGFSLLPTLTTTEQFDLLDLDPRLQQAFRMVDVEVPPELVPWSSASLPILDDDFDDHWNRAPNHYTVVGRGPKGALRSAVFDQYKEVTFEFVREQVASAVMHGRVYEFHLHTRPRPSILPALLSPIELLLPTEPIRIFPTPRIVPEEDEEPSPPATAPSP